MKIFVTGIAGFIGFHLSEELALNGHEILGIDNLNDYYDPSLKLERLRKLGISSFTNESVSYSSKFSSLGFKCADIADFDSTFDIINEFSPDMIVHLAAQAGVRYSLENPKSYINSNILGFYNIIEICRKLNLTKLIYASSSSVYGNSNENIFSENDKTDEPVSLYAATKKSNELFAYAYMSLFNISSIGLRFFTVYGPYGRPDMAYYSFLENIIQKKPIKLYNNGNVSRDFTYVKDVVISINKIIQQFDSITLNGKNRILNIGNSNPVILKKFINIIEQNVGVQAICEKTFMQSGDVYSTHADCSLLSSLIGYRPTTSLDEGIKYFVDWYKAYKNI
jgi:UDP-glucuronate 4-epimerase